MSARTAFATLLLLGTLVSCGRRRAGAATAPDGELWIDPASVAAGAARSVPVQEALLPVALRAAGRIAFDDTRVSHIFSPVNGRITRVIAQPGQEVHRGDPLAALSSPDLGSAVADELKARADLVAAEHEYERQKALIAAEAGPRRDLETAQDNVEKARAEERRALERLRLLRTAKVDQVTQEFLLTSPIDGRVMARAAFPGLEVQGQFSGGTAVELFTVGRIDSVWLLADAGETDVPKLQVGASISARVLAYPGQSFAGRVDWTSATLDPATRTARVRCVIPNPDEKLKPEMYAAVEIQQPATLSLAVPARAIVRFGEASFVFVASGVRPDGRLVFVRRRVEPTSARGPAPPLPGREGDVPAAEADLVSIASGVAVGEQVLLEAPAPSRGADGDLTLEPDQVHSGRFATAEVTPSELADAVTVGGRVTFDEGRVSHVFPPVNGRVVKLLAPLGNQVQRGTPLALMLSADVGSALSDTLKGKADLVAAEHEATRQRELYALRATARRDMETAEDNYQRARAEYERARLKTRLLGLGDGEALSQQFTLRSPIDGQVLARTANPGVEVQGQYSGGGSVPELFTVGSIDRLWLLGDIYELDIPFVHAGAEVELRVPAYPGRTFTAKIDWISDVLDPVARTAKVRCVLDNADGALRPEMYGALRIPTPSRKLLAVPREAVVRLGEENIVFVADPPRRDGKLTFHRRLVQAEESVHGQLVPVTAGLEAGERVATTGAILLLGMLQSEST